MTLEPIDTARYKPATLRDQPQPVLIWAKVAELVIDRRYQREITAAGRNAIQRIANNFDWKKYQPILVAPATGGRMAVVDGQHRAHAAAVLGLEAIPAMTVPMTPSEQAAGFVSINRDRIRMSTHNVYRAELEAGTEWAVQARDAVEKSGCHLATANPSSATKKPGTVFAVNLIRKMISNGEGAAVTEGLRAILESQASEEVDSYTGPALSVWLTALAKNQQFFRLDLPTIFDGLDIIDLLDKSRRRAREMGVPARKLATDEVVAQLTAHKDARQAQGVA